MMSQNRPQTGCVTPNRRGQVTVPVLAEVISMGDGSVVLKPKTARITASGDTWLTPREAGKILGICSRLVYRYCDQMKPLLACRRPARAKLLVSMKTVNQLYQATLNPDFWTDKLQQKEICEYARQVLEELREE